KLSLKAITPVGKDGTSALPRTTFTYGAFGYTEALDGHKYPAGGWNRLTQVDNGQGGVVALSYETIGAPPLNQPMFENNRRLISKTLSDGRGNNYTWTYRYGTPNYNVLGANAYAVAPSSWQQGNQSIQTYPNSAALYYNAFHSLSNAQ